MSAGAAPPDALTRARDLYNDRQYDASLAAAAEARRTPATADAAALVFARAHLERFRRTTDAADLKEAREALTSLDPARLAPRDRLDFTIGLGEALYLDGRFGAAAELFEHGVASNGPLGLGTRERLLDWWASALDRQAQVDHQARADRLARADRQAPPAGQQAPTDTEAADTRDWGQRRFYNRMLQRMEDELRRNAGSAVAAYWVVVGARGIGDLERAWNSALAGWVRAPMAIDRGRALRVDLDRLMQDAIIPERARLISPPGDLRDAITAMRADWDAFKQQWPGR